MFAMTLILMSYYKGNLKAALQVRTLTLPINSLEDILESPMHLIVWRGGNIESGYMLAPTGSVQRQIYEQKISGKRSANDIGGRVASLEIVGEGDAIYNGAIDAFRMTPDYPCKMIDVKKMR